jgi:hypothetical protein
MSYFLMGMASVGNLYPKVTPQANQTSVESAWQDVANAFYQTGKALGSAFWEQDAYTEPEETSAN